MRNWAELRSAVEVALRAWGDLFVQEYQGGSLSDATVWAEQISALTNIIPSLYGEWPDEPLSAKELEDLHCFLAERDDSFEELTDLRRLLE
jgi:hypothetical protein